jgi:hypothetical protein
MDSRAADSTHAPRQADGSSGEATTRRVENITRFLKEAAHARAR